MEKISDISVLNLLYGYLLLLIPIFLIIYHKTGLLKSVLIAILRMTVQLSFVALYLEFIFKLNNAWLNILWVVVMLVTASFTTVKRSGLKRKYFVLPLLISGFFSLIIIDSFFLGLVIHLDYVFEARYFIPISGMIIGNSMSHNIVGLSTFYKSLYKEKSLYRFLLINTGSTTEAISPFIKEAIRRALNPFIANMSTIGLISLPGMMTGQILGGSSPETAIKYQIMIMISIFTACTLNLIMSFYFNNKIVFDELGNLKEDTLK
jgi:putative ABC transport system permease protein